MNWPKSSWAAYKSTHIFHAFGCLPWGLSSFLCLWSWLFTILRLQQWLTDSSQSQTGKAAVGTRARGVPLCTLVSIYSGGTVQGREGLHVEISLSKGIETNAVFTLKLLNIVWVVGGGRKPQFSYLKELYRIWQWNRKRNNFKRLVLVQINAKLSKGLIFTEMG